jgi:ribonuclease E
MATKRMLIDAAHPEEIRVAIMNENTLEELDVESATRRQLKGNIYLAKVTRVEPSLQAAFIDYGGNRHGFLAFSEIHPDYYQIPIADRDELLAEESAASEDHQLNDGIGDDDIVEQNNNDKGVETVGGDDIDEVSTHRNFFPAKRYKIQEVIKRRQIMLIQVNKEERGNKGAALTTYISLAGRYCVLMPNTGKGGGISRKISNGSDRKRLKEIISGFNFPQGMAVIVRTAGADRSKAEIKRDYEYLIKLWTGIRDLTLKSTAPALIHEEGSIIKRAVRDHYSRDIEEVIVEGEDGYRQAKNLMKMLVPSHAKKVQPYKDTVTPLFSKYQIEAQLDSMNNRQVQLKSGGYIVIDITEALIAVDVNSGRATRGRNIEETAVKTNVEAAAEVARQVRLRDLAGLVVIDFIDMENHRNQVLVERRLKEAMRRDRARIQIGRISPFGLLELSRQRLRPSITETMTEVCPHCGGSGNRRSIESTALHVLRGIEEEGARQRTTKLEVFVHSQVALYVLNQKREAIAEIEKKFTLKIIILEDDDLIPPDFNINSKIPSKQTQMNPKSNSRNKPKPSGNQSNRPILNEKEDDSEGQTNTKRRRRPRTKTNVAEAQAIEEKTDSAVAETTTEADGTEKPVRRRRGRRGGRRRDKTQEELTNKIQITTQTEEKTINDLATPLSSGPTQVNKVSASTPTMPGTADDQQPDDIVKRRRVRRRKESSTGTKKSQDSAISSTKNSLINETGLEPKAEINNKPAADPDKPIKPKTENTNNSNVIVVGETEEKKPSNDRGGWWNKITGG